MDNKIHYTKILNGLDFKNEHIIKKGRPTRDNDAVNSRNLMDMLNVLNDTIQDALFIMHVDITKDGSIRNFRV